MTAPAATTRITPTGKKIGRGTPIYYTFSNNPDLNIFEKTAVFGGVKLDERRDQTTSFNAYARTFRPGRLRTYKDHKIVANYDPDQLQEIWDQVGVRCTITATLPTGTQVAFYGWLDEIGDSTFDEQNEPTIELTIAVSNQDWDTCTEALPTIVTSAGTGADC